MVSGPADDIRESSRWARWRRREFRVSTNVVAILLVVLGVVTAVQAWSQDSRTDRLAVCLTAYANGFADALDARSQATSDAQNALDDLMATVGAVVTQAEDRDEFVGAVEKYLRLRAEARETQAANPYPPAPREACEEA